MSQPTTTDEVAEIVRSSGPLYIEGEHTKDPYSVRARGTAAKVTLSPTGPTLNLAKLAGIIHVSPPDQVVSVKAGTGLWDLQRELEPLGLCLPMVDWYDGYSPLNSTGTVGGDLSMNLPKYLDAECGTWKDWILGLTVVLADGTICKSGSHAVKSVAGFDLHKLFVGARGTLGVVTEVIFRATPTKSLPHPTLRTNWLQEAGTESCTLWIQRTAAEHFEEAWENAKPYYSTAYLNTRTIWSYVPDEIDLPRFPGDWVIRAGCGEKNLQITDPTQVKLMKRAKEIFDPTGKLNPGEMGIF